MSSSLNSTAIPSAILLLAKIHHKALKWPLNMSTMERISASVSDLACASTGFLAECELWAVLVTPFFCRTSSA